MAYEKEKRTKRIIIMLEPLEIVAPMACTNEEIKEMINAEIESAINNKEIEYAESRTTIVCWYCKTNIVPLEKEGELCDGCTEELISESM